jgi:hypothetical protein
MSAQTDRLLLWHSIRCGAPGPKHQAQHAGVENVSRSFHAQREQQSTRFGSPRNMSFSRSKDGTSLMWLPSGSGLCDMQFSASLTLRA